MSRNNRIYIGIVTIWLLMLGGALSPVQAYQPVQTYQSAQQPSAWRTKPVMSNDLYPADYRFQSTSTYTPVVGKTSYTTAETYNPFETSSPRRARSEYDPWNDTDPSEELAVGEVGATPIGSPLILLLLAMLYLLKKKIVLISKSTNFKKILKK